MPKNDVKVLENSSEIIQDVKDFSNDLILKKDIDEYGALDYLAVSDDKTDENWFSGIIEMTDQVSKSITEPVGAMVKKEKYGPHFSKLDGK